MCKKLLIALLLCLSLGKATPLRISLAYEHETLNSTKMTTVGSKPQEYYIDQEVIITEQQVKRASVSASERGTIYLTFTEQGQEKLRSHITGSDSKLAFLIDGKLAIVPPVRPKILGSSFLISGLDSEYTQEQLRNMCLRMEGKPKLEVNTLQIEFPTTSLKPLSGAPYIESIIIKNKYGMQNNRGLESLQRLAQQLPARFNYSYQEESISKNCDLVNALAFNYPKVEALVKSTKGNEVSVKSLFDLFYTDTMKMFTIGAYSN